MNRFRRVLLGVIGILAAVLIGQGLLALHVGVWYAFICAITAGRVFSIFEDALFDSMENSDKHEQKQDEKP